MKTIIPILLVWGMNCQMCAQHYFGLLYPDRTLLNASVHADPSLGFGGSYFASREKMHLGKAPLGIGGSLHIPLSAVQGFDFDLRLGAGCLLDIHARFKTIAGLSWGLHRSADLNGRYWNTGLKLDLYPGHYGERWVIAPHLGLDWRPVVHLLHSAYAREAFQGLNGNYTTPQDGWFRQRFWQQQLGLSALHYRPRWNVQLTAGWQHYWNRKSITLLPDIGILPFYGSLRFGYLLAEGTP